MNGQTRALGNFFVDIGKFLPLFTVKIESNNFSLCNKKRSANQIDQKKGNLTVDYWSNQKSFYFENQPFLAVFNGRSGIKYFLIENRPFLAVSNSQHWVDCRI